MKPRFRPVIRVFVSSTFSDLKAKRNILQREVFPRLEQYCLIRGFQFQAIDLRWGVSGEAGLDHRTTQICFDELRRAQEVSPRPNFLVLLGDRYGWQPLAEVLTESEFSELERAAGQLDDEDSSDKQAGGSATQVLRTWYRRMTTPIATSATEIVEGAFRLTMQYHFAMPLFHLPLVAEMVAICRFWFRNASLGAGKASQ
jgi:hypothetical protein